MTKEQIDILNDAICNLQLLCKGMDCSKCHMLGNCGKSPSEWELISYDDVVGFWGESEER